MKNMSKVTVFTLVIYLLFAFVVWDLNCGRWDDGARFLFAYIVGVMYMIIVIWRYMKD